MRFDPDREPCGICGREVEECVCGFAPDIPLDEPLLIEDDQFDLDDDESYERRDDETTRN